MDIRRPEARLLLGATALATPAALAAGCEPTGLIVLDMVLSVVLVGVAVVGGAGAPPILLVGVGLVAAVGASGSVWGLLGVASAAIGLAYLLREPTMTATRKCAFGALSAALSAVGLLNLGSGPFTGSTALIAAACFGALFYFAVLGLEGRTRRLVARGVWVGAALVVLATMTAGAAVLGGRPPAERGIDAARAGLEFVRVGDLTSATSQLEVARNEFAAAGDAFGSWWSSPGRLVPVLSQQLDALEAASEHGSQISVAAQDTLAVSDLESLRDDGAIDVEAVSALTEPLTRSAKVLEVAKIELEEVNSAWLVGPISRRLNELASELIDVSDDLAKAKIAVDAVPDLVGADGPRRYLVILATPSETRELGGIVGSVVEMTLSDGRLSFSDAILNEDLNAQATLEGLADPSSYPSRFVANEPERYSQNWTGTVDFPTAARAIGELYPQMGGKSLDGVLYIDPVAIESILRITGPISVPGPDRTLGADEIVDWLTRGQYEEFPDQADRTTLLAAVSEEAMSQLMSTPIPDLGALVDTLTPAVSAGHLRFATFHEGDQALLDQLGITGEFDPPPGDVVTVLQANASEDKLDAYLQRALTYDVTVDPDGSTMTANLAIELTNMVPEDAPAYMLGGPDDPHPVGTNIVQVSILGPNQLSTASIDGNPTVAELNRELGLLRYTVFVDVAPGQTRTVDFALSGELVDQHRYSLWWNTVPRINPDEAKLILRRDDGAALDSDLIDGPESMQATVLGPQDAQRLVATFEPTGSQLFNVVLPPD